MPTLTDLAANLDRLAASIGGEASRIAKLAAETILIDLAGVTPADTGAAISNWQVSLDQPVAIMRTPFAPSPRGRMVQNVWTHAVPPNVTRDSNAPQTISAGMTIISSALPGQPICITSVLPYISILNTGTSKQEPAGFVERAEIHAQAVVNAARK